MRTEPFIARWGLPTVLAGVLGLSACGGADREPPAAQLPGQVGAAAAPSISHYAASRFLEQATMGPSPASVARLKSVGINAWLDEQMRKPVTLISTPSDLLNFNQNVDRATNQRAWRHHYGALHDLAVTADDQLRYRTSWVLSNFLVISTRKVSNYGGSEYWNLLMNHAFGSYGDLLKAVSRSPAMGNFLDNNLNRQDSLNENYGRELMQLFSVGLVQLNPDGSAKRDASGRPLETYSQKDVIEMTRALTGWQFAPNPANELFRPNNNFANYAVAMIPRENDHDKGQKVVLGKVIPAGGTATSDLDAVVKILMEHPNTAPFVSLRLIQGLTTSDPSAAYLRRVVTVFQQTQGNLGSVIRAILTDEEARRGDNPVREAANFGRIREPFLQLVAVQRGMSCQKALRWRDGEDVMSVRDQMPLSPYTVFNFYPPNHRAPGSNLLAPEQKTLVSTEFDSRLGRFHYQLGSESHLRAHGCDADSLLAAVRESDDAVIELINQRYLRGAMPPHLRQGMREALATKSFYREEPLRVFGALVQLATITPTYGAIK